MSLPKELTTVTPLSKIVALILFIFLPILGFHFGIKYQQLITNTNFTYLTSPSLTPGPIVVNDTGSWKTYTDNKNDFSLKYPSDWEVNKKDWGVTLYRDKNNDRQGISVEYAVSGPTLNDDNSDPLTHIEAHKNYYLNSTSYAFDGGVQLSKENVVVDGKSAVKYQVQPRLEKLKTPANIDNWVYIPLDGEIMQLSFPNDQRSLQVFSTFKFLEQNQTEVVDWKTYNSPEIGDYISPFQINYPSGWKIKEALLSEEPKSLTLTLTNSKNETIEILQGAGGGGTCLYYDDSDYEAYMGTGQQYSSYLQINQPAEWRISQFKLNNKATHAVCEKSKERYMETTRIGWIEINIESESSMQEVKSILEKI